MPIEPPDPLRILNSLTIVLAELRVLAAEHPALVEELRVLAAARPDDEMLTVVLRTVIENQAGRLPPRG